MHESLRFMTVAAALACLAASSGLWQRHIGV